MTDSKKKRTRRSFSDEFKRDAVALFQGSGVSAEQVWAYRRRYCIAGCVMRATIHKKPIDPVTRNSRRNFSVLVGSWIF